MLCPVLKSTIRARPPRKRTLGIRCETAECIAPVSSIRAKEVLPNSTPSHLMYRVFFVEGRRKPIGNGNEEMRTYKLTGKNCEMPPRIIMTATPRLTIRLYASGVSGRSKKPEKYKLKRQLALDFLCPSPTPTASIFFSRRGAPTSYPRNPSCPV